MKKIKRTPVKEEQLPKCFGKPELNCVSFCAIWAACIRVVDKKG